MRLAHVNCQSGPPQAFWTRSNLYIYIFFYI